MLTLATAGRKSKPKNIGGLKGYARIVPMTTESVPLQSPAVRAIEVNRKSPAVNCPEIPTIEKVGMMRKIRYNAENAAAKVICRIFMPGFFDPSMIPNSYAIEFTASANAW